VNAYKFLSQYAYRAQRVLWKAMRMGYPRHLHVRPDTAGIYHCVSRCVRRAFLCGEDTVTGRSFEHRKQWVEDRILKLGKIFAVAVHSYAVMSNHFHVILETGPSTPWQWSDEEVARRWLSLSAKTFDNDPVLTTHVAALVAQPERLFVLRQRLGSLSWYMRYLKEPIARQANREDECSGRFWEGRFRTQTLLDDSAVLASMVYVDLNPIRAGIADSPENSHHTSACARSQRSENARDMIIEPLASSIRSEIRMISAAQYLELIDWTTRTLHPHKNATVTGEPPPILTRLGLRTQQWCLQVSATESHYRRAIGQLEVLQAAAHHAGLRWIRGIGIARRLQRLAG
jgi:REP element-mobilizing transposase RayT